MSARPKLSPAQLRLLEHLEQPPAYLVGTPYAGRIALIDVRHGRTAAALLRRGLVEPVDGEPRYVKLSDAGRAELAWRAGEREAAEQPAELEARRAAKRWPT